MFLQKAPYQLIIALTIFLVCGILAIVLQQPLVVLFPFVWILFPLVFDYIVQRTENVFWLLILALPFSTELNITASLGIDFPDELLMMLLTGMTIFKMVHEPKWFPAPLIKQPLFFILLLVMGWSFISACYADNFLIFH